MKFKPKSRHRETWLWRQVSPFGMIVVLLVCAVWAGIGSCQLRESLAATDKNAADVSDDDYFVLMVTGRWEGHLEPCGCAEKQLGGIDRRTHLIKAAPESRRLLLDAGPVIENFGRQDELKFETFLASLKTLGYDAAALTDRELSLLKTLAIRPNDRPAVLGTNVPDALRESLGLIAVFEKTLRIRDRRLDCVVLALTLSPSGADSPPTSAPQAADVISTVRTVLTGTNVNPDTSSEKMVIVMLPVDQPNWVAPLKAIPAVDVIVTRGAADEPELKADPAGGAIEMTAGRMGKYIACLRIPVDQVAQKHKKSQSPSGRSQYQFERLMVESDFPRDPAIVRLIDDYQAKLRIENLVADEDKLPRRPLEEGEQFTGNSSCKSCHQEIFEKWRQFRHGHALATLEKTEVQRQFDPECVSCHAVGMMYQSGYRSRTATPDLADVGCESCHGPGKKHLENTAATYQRQFTACEECHDHETSPKFDVHREEYFKKIQHWKEPRRYWP